MALIPSKFSTQNVSGLMHETGSVSAIRRELTGRLAEARTLTDSFFGLICPDAFYDRPIPERHRFIFYLGHLEAFDWNLIGHHGLGREPIHAEFDKLFAFGIDPVDGNLPTDKPQDWPTIVEVHRYNRQVRRVLDACIAETSFSNPSIPLLEDGYLLHAAIEHRLMHAETLAYMLHPLTLEKKIPPRFLAQEVLTPAVQTRMIEIPEGTATLGQARKNKRLFGWDNEFELHVVNVPTFQIDSHNVTNGDFLKFVQGGGYEDRSLWTEADWEWKTKEGIPHPRFWIPAGGPWKYQAMFNEIPLPLNWPVYVSHAEAVAYAKWKGKSLPTEAEWHRAACGTPGGTERAYPWGNQLPDKARGNFDFSRWNLSPVGAYPSSRSAFGVSDLVGNGWEWTSTVFAPFPGFERFSFYPEYSQNFFDGKHYVMKGGSPRTSACLLRRSFRNWFQAHYPYVYATFRCVED